MSVDIGAVGAAQQSQPSMYTGSAGVRNPKQDMDSETFMTLLVAQLKYQDPSSPMNTNEMMAQTAQLASMEQLTRLTTTQTESFALQMRSAAADLIGKQVSYLGEDNEIVTGIVDAVAYAGEVPTVIIGDKEIPLDAVAHVAMDGYVPPVDNGGTDTDETTPDSGDADSGSDANTSEETDATATSEAGIGA